MARTSEETIQLFVKITGESEETIRELFQSDEPERTSDADPDGKDDKKPNPGSSQ